MIDVYVHIIQPCSVHCCLSVTCNEYGWLWITTSPVVRHALVHTSPANEDGLAGARRRPTATHHLVLLLHIPTLLVKRHVVVAAVEDRLVAPADLADVRERLDDAQPELLPLLALVHRDVLDVPDAPEPAQELALREERADRDDAVRRAVHDDDGEVRRGQARRADRGELRAPGGLARVGHDGEHGENLEVAARVVRGRQRAYLGSRSGRAECECARDVRGGRYAIGA